MQPGKLDQRVAFDAPRVTSDGAGGRVNGFVDAGSAYECAAHFRNLRGSETVIASRLSGVQPVVVTIRTSSAARAISTEYRMRDLRRPDDIYQIRAIVETDDRAFLELTCERGVTV